jgi:hypothetical protein
MKLIGFIFILLLCIGHAHGQDSLQSCLSVDKKYTGKCLCFLDDNLLIVKKSKNASFYFIQEKMNGRNFQTAFRKYTLLDHFFPPKWKITGIKVSDELQLLNDTITVHYYQDPKVIEKIYLEQGQIKYIIAKSRYKEESMFKYNEVSISDYSNKYSDNTYSFYKYQYNQVRTLSKRYVILGEDGWTSIDLEDANENK